MRGVLRVRGASARRLARIAGRPGAMSALGDAGFRFCFTRCRFGSVSPRIGRADGGVFRAALTSLLSWRAICELAI